MYSNLDELDEKIEYYVEDDKVREEIDYNLQQQCVSRVRPSSWLLITRPYHSFSITTPRCGRKMREVDYRWFECVCDYENDRDVIAIVNLNGRGLWPSHLPTRWELNWCGNDEASGENSRLFQDGEPPVWKRKIEHSHITYAMKLVLLTSVKLLIIVQLIYLLIHLFPRLGL